jgi:hypothetical protein
MVFFNLKDAAAAYKYIVEMAGTPAYVKAFEFWNGKPKKITFKQLNTFLEANKYKPLQ